MALAADGYDTDRGSSCTKLESIEMASVLYIYWSERGLQRWTALVLGMAAISLDFGVDD